MCRWWCGELRITAATPPSTRILSLRAPKSFLLAYLSRPSSSDLRYLRLPTKHSGASLELCVGIADSESNLQGLLEVAFTQRWRLAPIVAPRRWGLTLMSRTCDSWRALYRQCHPRESGLGWTSLCFYCHVLQKGLHTISLHNWSQWMHGNFVCRPAGSGTLSPFDVCSSL
jgi:hypothetical protein